MVYETNNHGWFMFGGIDAEYRAYIASRCEALGLKRHSNDKDRVIPRKFQEIITEKQHARRMEQYETFSIVKDWDKEPKDNNSTIKELTTVLLLTIAGFALYCIVFGVQFASVISSCALTAYTLAKVNEL